VPEYIGASIADLLADPQYMGLLLSIQRILEGRVSKQDLSGSFRIEGHARELRIDLVPALDATQKVTGCFVVLDDVTDLKLLESRLRKAEKMQAIGQLTGGVAHDFNNLLGVILGNLQLLERDLNHDPLLARKLSSAMRAAIRGGELTRSLLAFARHQVLEPAIVNLHRHLESVIELMQRTLDDSIELTLSLQKDLWYTQVDPGQLDNAVLNLVINARDAMPEGGRLILSARNISADAVDLLRLDLQPGDYIEVAVRDTGTGIAPPLLALVFEPFFTTKETGKGSGLGLSIVQGFAKQSGGTAAIESQQGVGTVVRLFLPRCTNDTSLDQDTLIQRPMPQGSETILVVEDDPELRATATLTLQRLGYEVKEASNGKVAMRLLREIPHIDMLFTDLVMPGGILGPELARMARELNPHIRVLFTTGYAGEAALTAEISAGHMLTKPYRNEELAQRVRKLLDKETVVE
jgi:signal transduction histidine kinase/CheY-like chemotaxis protein